VIKKKTITANVFLRTVSGKSLHELGQGPPPADLSLFRATPASREAVQRFFEHCGFRVFLDSEELFLSIEGSPALFAQVFGISQRGLSQVAAKDTTALSVPAEIQPFVETIVMLPPPEFMK